MSEQQSHNDHHPPLVDRWRAFYAGLGGATSAVLDPIFAGASTDFFGVSGTAGVVFDRLVSFLAFSAGLYVTLTLFALLAHRLQK
ncbi:hypothetical protein [Haloarchaeobius sp. DFWS5]|uniref:hypothetical protein n=1 Tax=Haloarchaeobius sp. DFWS5 TaxID=3446114 RepID=UPI003EBF70BD